MLMLKILHFPSQPHFFSYGGFDIQMNRVIEGLNNYNINSIKVDLWNSNQNFDIAHFWGSSNFHYENILLCKSINIPTIISALFPPLNPFDNFIISLKSKFSKIFLIKRALFIADYVLVINENQLELASKVYGVKREKIIVINTMLDKEFFTNNNLENTNCEFDNFALCVGTVCHRKNQLNLIKASLDCNQKIIFVGRLESTEFDYIENFKELIKSYPNLFKHFEDVSSTFLKSLYLRCQFVTCLSYSETEPATILEAMVLNKPLLVSNMPFSNFNLYNGVLKCNPHSIQSIISGLKNVKNNIFPNFVSDNYIPDNVYIKYVETYQLIHSKKI